MMSVHLDFALQKLKKLLLDLGSAVEGQVGNAVAALHRRDNALALAVIDNDRVIDQQEIDIEEECLKILSLYQPVAFDLRFVVAVLKINNDLERIGDYGSNIAERAAYLSQLPPLADSLEFRVMAEQANDMLKRAVEAFVKTDTQLAREVCAADAEIDTMHAANYRIIGDLITKYPKHASEIIQQLSVSRYLERIADLATNICEDILYLVEGKIVRHQRDKRAVRAE